jgi:hypothetical protein
MPSDGAHTVNATLYDKLSFNFMSPFQFHVADNAGLIGAALFSHSRRQLLANAAMAASRVAA